MTRSRTSLAAADLVPHPPAFQRLVRGGHGQGRVGAADDDLPPGPGPVNDGRSTSSHPSALWTLPGRLVLHQSVLRRERP